MEMFFPRYKTQLEDLAHKCKAGKDEQKRMQQKLLQMLLNIIV